MEISYPYDKLVVYHFGRKVVYAIRDAETARRYFAEFNPTYDSGCTEAYPEHGAPIF